MGKPLNAKISHLMEALKEVRGLHILVVDDDPSVRLILSKMLQVIGCKVTTAEDGIRGLDRFLHDSYDLVITDMEMPGMDGWSLAQRIKDHSPDTQIMMITGNPEIKFKDRVGLLDALVFKPFLFEDIRKTLLSLWQRRPAPDQKLEGLTAAVSQ